MKSHLLHTYREEVFVPILAITNNIEFVTGDKNIERIVLTSDNITAKVKSWKSVHILSDEAKELVSRLYKTNDVYGFMRKWYGSLDICSMEFVYLQLEKQ